MGMKTTLPLWLWRQPDQRTLLLTAAAPVNLSLIERSDFQRLIDDMIATMYQAVGIGLAAPQIGQSIRLAVIAREVDPSGQIVVLINPTLSAASVEHESVEEGCLSVPGVFGFVERPQAITVAALDRHGRPWQRSADGLFARVIQHEVDHLNGRLFLDRVSQFTRGQRLL